MVSPKRVCTHRLAFFKVLRYPPGTTVVAQPLTAVLALTSQELEEKQIWLFFLKLCLLTLSKSNVIFSGRSPCIRVLTYWETLSSAGGDLGKSLCLSQDNVPGLLSVYYLSFCLCSWRIKGTSSSLSEEMVGCPSNKVTILHQCSAAGSIREAEGVPPLTTGLLSMEKLGTGAHSAHGSNSVVLCEECLILCQLTEENAFTLRERQNELQMKQ